MQIYVLTKTIQFLKGTVTILMTCTKQQESFQMPWEAVCLCSTKELNTTQHIRVLLDTLAHDLVYKDLDANFLRYRFSRC